VWSGSIWR